MPAADVTPADYRRRTRRAFAAWAGAGLAGLGGWQWLRTRELDGGIPWPLRRIHRLNERVGRALFSPTHLAPEFPPGAAADPARVNGWHGWPAGPDGVATAPDWLVTVEQPGRPDRQVPASRLTAGLPRVEMTTEFKCIEGWSQVMNWGGVRFADWVAALGTGAEAHPYVSLSTPDGSYMVGLDTPSALHPQTLLCDTQNGRPLTPEHGGPVRLVLAVKYGIKNIKWVGRVRFQDDRPADYWAERGYDWYSGL